jgi:FimV-like protein
MSNSNSIAAPSSSEMWWSPGFVDQNKAVSDGWRLEPTNPWGDTPIQPCAWARVGAPQAWGRGSRRPIRILQYVVFLSVLAGLSSLASAGGEYGPTRPGESLWKIAAKIRGSRTTPIGTLMRQLYDLNPDAFLGGKMERLRVGAVLRIPQRATTDLSPPSPMEAGRQPKSLTSAGKPETLSRRLESAVSSSEPSGVSVESRMPAARSVPVAMSKVLITKDTQPSLVGEASQTHDAALPQLATGMPAPALGPVGKPLPPSREDRPASPVGREAAASGASVSSTLSAEVSNTAMPPVATPAATPAPPSVPAATPRAASEPGASKEAHDIPLFSAPHADLVPEPAAAPAELVTSRALWMTSAAAVLGAMALLFFLRLKGAKAGARSGAPAAQPESVGDLVERAVQQAASGNYNLARSALRRAIAIQPADYGLREKLLEIEYAQRDGASFSADAEELKGLLGSQAGELWGRIEAMGRTLCPHLPPFCPSEEAAARREAAVALAPEHDVPELLQRAEQESAIGNYNLARSALRQAIALSPGEPGLWLRLLRVEHAQGDRASFAADAKDMLALPGAIKGEILNDITRMQSSFA